MLTQFPAFILTNMHSALDESRPDWDEAISVICIRHCTVCDKPLDISGGNTSHHTGSVKKSIRLNKLMKSERCDHLSERRRHLSIYLDREAGYLDKSLCKTF